MELKAVTDIQSKPSNKPCKRPRPNFDDEHWVQFFEEANSATEESYRTIRSF